PEGGGGGGMEIERAGAGRARGGRRRLEVAIAHAAAKLDHPGPPSLSASRRGGGAGARLAQRRADDKELEPEWGRPRHWYGVYVTCPRTPTVTFVKPVSENAFIKTGSELV